MATVEFLWAVAWRPKGDGSWACVKDEHERVVPAVYIHQHEARERADQMAEAFEDCEYKVVVLNIIDQPVSPGTTPYRQRLQMHPNDSYHRG